MRMKIKKIVSITLVCFILLASIVGNIPINMASAGQDEFIAPLFSEYVEDENKTIITGFELNYLYERIIISKDMKWSIKVSIE